MTTRRISNAAREYIALFEAVTDVAATDCVIDEAHERVVFVVPSDAMSRAIGPDGAHVQRVEERIGWTVDVVADADDPAEFVANALRPAAVYDVTLREQERDGEDVLVAYAEVDADDMGAAIGADGRNVSMAHTLVGRQFDVGSIELVPDPEGVIAEVASRTDVEPIDCIFDPTDERLLVVVPSGTVGEVVGEGGATVRAIERAVGWDVDVVGYDSDPAEFVANALAPADVLGVTVSENDTTVAYAEVPDEERGAAIGRGGRTIRRARLLAALFYGIDDVELT